MKFFIILEADRYTSVFFFRVISDQKTLKEVSKNLFNILKIFYRRDRPVRLKIIITEYPPVLKKNILISFSIKYLKNISKNESISIYIINNI
jgi:hypothetical protein